MMLQIPLRKDVQRKRALRALKPISPKVITISLLNPPLFYRKAAAQKKTYYYF